MKQTKIIMGMPVTIDIAAPDGAESENAINKAFAYFDYIDETFSTYKESSEITKINRGELRKDLWSEDMKTVFALSQETRELTGGYFDITTPEGRFDPSGLVKGWAINNAAYLVKNLGFDNFYIDAGGDIQAFGINVHGRPWSIGIKNPLCPEEVVKVLSVSGKGVATSGTYIRGNHIYNPKDRNSPITEVASLTVIGPNIYEADRFATAAFAMGKRGIQFIESLKGFEGYMIDRDGIAVMTSGFNNYTETKTYA